MTTDTPIQLPPIFPDEPKLTRQDIDRLLPHITEGRVALRSWLRVLPPKRDCQLAVLLEIRRARLTQEWVKRYVIDALLKRIRDCEMQEREASIYAHLRKP